MTSQIQKLASEAAQLWDAINKTDCELLRLRSEPSDGSARTADNTGRIEALQRFFDEATDRVTEIEDYLMTLSPTDTRDAVVLLSIATAIAKLPVGARYTLAQHERALPRLLAEVLAFLEREAGATAKDLAGDAFGVTGSTWQGDFSQMVASLAAARPIKTAHNA